VQKGWRERLRHLAYAGGWKKFEPLWDVVIRAGQVSRFLPLLERVLDGTSQQVGESASQRISEAANQRVSKEVTYEIAFQ